MYKQLLSLVFLSFSVIASNFTPPLQAGVEKLERKTTEWVVRQKLEQSLLVKICRSNIPPLITGIPLCRLGFLIGSCIDVFTGSGPGFTEKNIFKIILTSGGLAIGYLPVATTQYLILKKLGV